MYPYSYLAFIVALAIPLIWLHREVADYVNRERWANAIGAYIVIAAIYIIACVGWPLFAFWVPPVGMFGGDPDYARPYMGVVFSIGLAWFIIPMARDAVHYLHAGKPRKVVFAIVLIATSLAFLLWWFHPLIEAEEQ